MQRIVIDGAIFGLQQSGGISRFWADALLGLDESFAKDVSISLLLPRNRNIEWESVSSQLSNIHIVPRRRFRWDKRGFLQESLYLTWLALKLRPSIWHSSYYVGFPLKFCNHRILSFYDMIPEVLGDKKKYDVSMKLKSLHAAGTIVSISNHSKKDLVNFCPAYRNKIEVIHLSADGRKTQKEKNDVVVPTPYFLFIGKREGYKNFLTCLEQILPDERYKNYHIVAAGGENGFSEKELRTILKHRAKDRVHYIGTLLPDEVDKLMEEAAILLYPSIYEGFGLPVLEAFSKGVPVLACKSSSIPEITGSEYPLADPGHPAGFLDILKELLENKEKWVNCGKERAKLFSRARMIRSLCDLYVKNL